MGSDEDLARTAASVGLAAAPRAAVPVDPSPGWVDDVVLYGVIPTRFGPEGLRSVTERLPELAELGVNALWLSPIFRAPEGDYGYAVTDYLSVDPRHGTAEDLRGLVDRAHALGIRVLLDLVPNHTSDRHPFFEEAQRGGPGSPRWDYYDRDEAGRPTHYFDWTNLPNLNLDHPEVRAHLFEASRFWIRELDIDGYRVDVAWGVADRAPDFWPEWRAALKALKPDLLLIAEAGARDPRYVGRGFDAAYDWADELGHWAWEGVFDGPGVPARLHAALTNDGRGYPAGTRIVRFLANNDTGPRFTAVRPRGLTRVAAALLLTLPGIPCLFTGDELALAYEPYDGGGPLDWRGDRDLREWFRRLIALRAELPALRSADWTPLSDGRTGETYAYLRGAGAGQALVVLNFGVEPETVALRLPDGVDVPGRRLVDRLSDETYDVDGAEVTVPLPACAARVLLPTSGRETGR